eukprot:6543150-Pyramimonas_sp.AAC.1
MARPGAKSAGCDAATCQLLAIAWSWPLELALGAAQLLQTLNHEMPRAQVDYESLTESKPTSTLAASRPHRRAPARKHRIGIWARQPRSGHNLRRL